MLLGLRKRNNLACKNIQVGADLIIQVGSDSILLCSVIYKFVTINTFNCHGTIAFMCVKRLVNMAPKKKHFN